MSRLTGTGALVKGESKSIGARIVEPEGLRRIGIIGNAFERDVMAMSPLERSAVFPDVDDASRPTAERIAAPGGWR